jgi:hypothetical protein
MAATSFVAMQRAQEATLQSKGFVIKNGFIDEPAAEPAAGGSRARRQSAPPSMTRFDSARHTEFPVDDSDKSRDNFDKCLESDDDASTRASSSSPCRRMRSSDTASTFAEDGGDSGRECVDEGASWATEELRRAILTSCGFLRIQGSSYRPVRCRSGCTGSLIFYVAGLPWARRAKWVVPLRLSVSKVLEGCGYCTTMHMGVLYVVDPESSLKVRVGFAPSLRSAK